MLEGALDLLALAALGVGLERPSESVEGPLEIPF